MYTQYFTSSPLFKEEYGDEMELSYISFIEENKYDNRNLKGTSAIYPNIKRFRITTLLNEEIVSVYLAKESDMKGEKESDYSEIIEKYTIKIWFSKSEF